MHIPREHSVTPPTLDYYTDARDSFCGDPASQLAALLIDHIRESRQSSLERTRAETDHLRVVQAAQIEDLRKEADKLRDASVVNGWGKVVSGALTVGSGVFIACTKNPDNAWSKGLEGGASGTVGVAELYAAGHEYLGRSARTRATEHEHLASESERRLKTLEEARTHLRELQRTACDHLRSVQETQAQTDRARVIWRG